MLLAIDAGNSFVKLAFHDGAAWGMRARVSLKEFPEFAQGLREQQAPRTVMIANVAGDRFRLPMLDVLRQWNCGEHWIESKGEAYGIQNGYEQPGRLGVDRWAALIGANKLVGGPLMVVSVGTAVTIDLLDPPGRFTGGIIIPGLELMQASLAEKTVGIDGSPGEYSPRPTATADAVKTGALYAVTGAIEKAMARMPEAGRIPELILTGGGASEVEPLLNVRCRLIPDLVLEGLLCIAREEKLL